MADGQLNLKPGMLMHAYNPSMEYHSKFKASLVYSVSLRLARAL